MKINTIELEQFLSAAHKATYANKLAIRSKSLRPSSKDYHFEHGDLIYHDTYFGSRDFIGEEVIYESDTPIWAMNYYGFILKENISTQDAYSILRPALMQEFDDILPVRGPKTYTEGRSEYKNSVNGDITRFSGTEAIYLQGEHVYQCWYHGGTIR